jgi:predicted RNA methylase
MMSRSRRGGEEMNNKQSSVVFFWNQLPEILPFTVNTETAIKLLEAFEQAKEMHKKEIIDAVNSCGYIGGASEEEAEDYYNETFQK